VRRIVVILEYGTAKNHDRPYLLKMTIPHHKPNHSTEQELNMAVKLSKQSIDLGIVTTNGPAMLTFYRDVLGFEYLREMPMPGGAGTMHQMLCGESMIKLVVLEQTPAAAAPGGIQGATGYRYWAITVGNMPELLQSCADQGHKVVMKAREIRPGVTISIVADPDGNWVEFLSLN
jgi:catechol 2,3-dioxygenase-like lactoylglutathione lyase family enzyme